MQYHRNIIAAMLSCLFFDLLSCSLEYDSKVSDDLDESIPTSILYNVNRVQVQNGEPKVSFKAEEAVIWDDKEETELFRFIFREYGESRDIITEGQADYLIITDNQDARIEGHISGSSVRNEASIEAQNLSWEDEKRILKSDIDSTVIIEMDNGSLLEGQGFEADMFTNTSRFSEGIGGILESGADENE